jgi:hypothetical protein
MPKCVTCNNETDIKFKDESICNDCLTTYINKLINIVEELYLVSNPKNKEVADNIKSVAAKIESEVKTQI